jgi:DNA-directed RNA polymerase specialized sigma24 family protein
MEHIYSRHKHWVSIVKKFGEVNYAEDVVQEAYIKVYLTIETAIH